MKRSEILTHPISAECENSSSPSPKANSVDPPPISITRLGPVDEILFVAPRNVNLASSEPSNISGLIVVTSSAAIRKMSLFLASRTAEVATNFISETS